MLTIGFDGRFIGPRPSGIGRYSLNLLSSIGTLGGRFRLVVFLTADQTGVQSRLLSAIGAGRLKILYTCFSAYDPRALLEWPSLLRRARLDVFHAPYHPWAPIWTPCPLVVTAHDLIFDRYPFMMPQVWQWPGYKILSGLALRRARRVVAVSQSTRSDILRLTGTAAAAVETVHLGVEPRFAPLADTGPASAVRARYGLPARYVLALGNGRPHKNMKRLVRAFSALPIGIDQVLVIAGDSGNILDIAPTPARIQKIDFIEDADLPAVYGMAEAFIQPSVMEGFGLPVLEAMACGCPVLCSTADGLIEVAQEAALTFDALSVPDMTLALARMLGSEALRARHSANGLRRAAEMSWERTAAATLQIYAAAIDCRQEPDTVRVPCRNYFSAKSARDSRPGSKDGIA